LGDTATPAPSSAIAAQSFRTAMPSLDDLRPATQREKANTMTEARLEPNHD
jgi:hypothetical protein